MSSPARAVLTATLGIGMLAALATTGSIARGAQGAQTRPSSSTQPSAGAPATPTKRPAPAAAPVPDFPPADFNAAASDPRAIALAMKAMEAMGGLAAWQAVPSVRFAFEVERDGQVVARRIHWWDRFGDRHRIESTEKDGKRLVVSQTLATHQGTAARDGVALKGEELKTALKEAYGRWINDTYWLLMPFKTFDPGVKLTFEGERRLEGATFNVFRLTFDKVGLTPGDTYWAWVNTVSQRMEVWSYHLQGTPAEQPPSVFAWEDWKEFGSVHLSLNRRPLDPPAGKPVLGIRFKDVALLGPLPDAVFDVKSPVAAPFAP